MNHNERSIKNKLQMIIDLTSGAVNIGDMLERFEAIKDTANEALQYIPEATEENYFYCGKCGLLVGKGKDQEPVKIDHKCSKITR